MQEDAHPTFVSPYDPPVGRVVQCIDSAHFDSAINCVRQPDGQPFPTCDDNGTQIIRPRDKDHLWIVLDAVTTTLSGHEVKLYICVLCMKIPEAPVAGVKGRYIGQGNFGVDPYTHVQWSMVAALPAGWIKDYTRTRGSIFIPRTDVPEDNNLRHILRQEFVLHWKRANNYKFLLEAHTTTAPVASAASSTVKVRVKPRRT